MKFSSPPTPVPFDDHGAQTLFTAKRAPRDVVQSPAARRIGFHVDYHVLAANSPVAATSTFINDVDFNDCGDAEHDDDRARESAPPESDTGALGEQDEIRRRDRAERLALRGAAQRVRLERRAQRFALVGLSGRRRARAGTGALDAHDEQPDRRATSLRLANRFSPPTPGHHDRTTMPIAAHVDESRGVANVATYPHHVKRFASGPLHGTALAIYFILLPYVVITKWGLSAHQTNASLVRTLLVVLSVFWLTFLFQVVRNVVRLRRGTMLSRDGSAWLAGLVVMVMPFILPTSAGATLTDADVALSSTYVAAHHAPSWTMSTEATTNREASPIEHSPLTHPSPAGALPLALIAKRRKDSLRQHQFALDETEIDEVIALLRADNPRLIAQLRHSIGDGPEGVVIVEGEHTTASASDNTEPVVVCALGAGDQGVLVSFAREGGHLLVREHWNHDDVINAVVALHDGGKIAFASNESELLRTLATRSLRSTLVIYLGVPGDLDRELRSCAITIGAFESRETDPDDRPSLGLARPPATPTPTHFALRAELLRSEPRVVGLVEPFTATLRRRCVEMVTYLALHRGEPVTGDRLRTRVLTHADADASVRTLANTASAVRRSLGADALGPRLHAVSSSGLYATHDLTSDVEIFHDLVTRARRLSTHDAAPLVREALDLVHGEPLATALRGFEWFLAEGHAARLARDGEWAALALHHDSLERGDYELAFWALQRGRLMDPFSDVLVEALTQVPRLREFGGDGSGRAQHEPVGARGTEEVSWSFDRLRHQIA